MIGEKEKSRVEIYPQLGSYVNRLNINELTVNQRTFRKKKEITRPGRSLL
jgi:hypothetical protein